MDAEHQKAMQTEQYCFRVSFRNAITKEKRVLYIIASPISEFASTIDTVPGAASSGPVDSIVLKIKSDIRVHQQNLFDDVPDEVYRSKL